MTFTCPYCKKTYDVEDFGDKQSLRCECGVELSLEHDALFNQIDLIVKQYEAKLEDEKIAEIRMLCDSISSLILNDDYPEVDIEIEKMRLKELIKNYFPAKEYLYEMLYESRFKRLWEQFRKHS